MRKLVLLCTILAAVCCVAYADMKVSDDAAYALAKDRYYQIIERIDAGTATRAEVVEIGDLCQVYGWELPAALLPPEPEPPRGSTTLDAGTDCASATDITSCPFSESGNLDGDDDCSVFTTPYGDVIYRFIPPFTGRYQMRLQTATYQGSIRIVTGACCTSGTTVTRSISSNSIGSDCESPTTGITYLGGLFSRDTTYWIYIGTTGSNYTVSYQFNLWCIPCPPRESAVAHDVCTDAQQVLCGDSLLGYLSSTSPYDWYKVTITEPESLIAYVVGRELGHCISGYYPGSQTTYDTATVDARIAIFKGCAGAADSLTFDDDGTHGYISCQYDAVAGVCVNPGTYYFKVGLSGRTGLYVFKLRCTPCVPPVPPSNDLCDNAISVGIPSATPGYTNLGTVDTPPLCVYTPTSPGVWYKVVGNGHFITADLCISSFDTRMNVYTGDCANLVCVGADDDACDAPNASGSKYTWCAQDGVAYFILVYGFSTYVGTFTLTITDGSNCGTGACCFADGSCQAMTQDECLGNGGTFKGYGVSCTPNPCPQPCLWPNRDDENVNNTCSGDVPLVACNDTLCGSLPDANDAADWYQIVIPEGECDTIVVKVFANATPNLPPYGQGLDSYVALYASDCVTQLAYNDDNYGTYPEPVGYDSKLMKGCLTAGTYYIRVTAPYTGHGPYVLVVQCIRCTCPNPCPYVNRDIEPDNNTCSETVPYASCGDTLCGTIAASDVDWYKLVIAGNPGECKLAVIDVFGNDTPGMWPYGMSLDPMVWLYKADCASMILSNDDNNGTAPAPVGNDSRVSKCLFPGIYYIKVGIGSYPGLPGPYVLAVACTPCTCPDTTGDNCGAPRVIASLPYTNTATTCGFVDDYNATCLGYYDGGPDVIYKFTVATQTCATCSLVNVTASSYPGLAVFDGCPDVGTCLTYNSGSSGPLGTSCLVFSPGHDYYIMVDNWPSPACINAYTLKLDPCDCPLPCDAYTLCGQPGEVEPNDVCPVANQPVIGCDMTVYGLHCPNTDVDYWQVVVPPMSIMTLQLYSGMNCDVNPAVGILMQYFDDACANASTGTSSALSISNMTASPLVKYLKVYDSGALSQTLYKVVATCCHVTDYCEHPIYTGTGTFSGGAWTYDSTANTCCATNVVDTVGSTGCTTGSRFVSGPDVVFKFILTRTNIVSISVNSVGSGDGQFSLFTDCANPKTSCVMSQDATTGTTPEVANNLVLPAGTYYVSVSDYGATACGLMHIHIISDCPLPVELMGDVVATAGNEKVTLSWTTASETNNDHFEIVRAGRVIARVPGAGTSATRHDYTWSEEGLSNGTTYDYALQTVDVNANVLPLATVSATPSFAAGEVTEYALHQNYPNPFNPLTSIAFDLLDNGNVSLKIYNLMGQEVRTVVSGMMPKGRHIVTFDAGNLASGIYLYRIEVNGFTAEKKMLLMK